jgi:hypothetical protein
MRISKDEIARTATALRKHRGNLMAAARELGVARSTLVFRIRRYGLDRKLPGVKRAPGMSIEEFRREHDRGYAILLKLKGALRELGQNCLYESAGRASPITDSIGALRWRR